MLRTAYSVPSTVNRAPRPLGNKHYASASALKERHLVYENGVPVHPEGMAAISRWLRSSRDIPPDNSETKPADPDGVAARCWLRTLRVRDDSDAHRDCAQPPANGSDPSGVGGC